MNTEKKNNKFFLNLENRAASKTCIRKVFNKEEKMIVEPNAVRDVLYNFYADLYENKDSEHYLVIGEEFLDRCMNLPKHSDEKKLSVKVLLPIQSVLKHSVNSRMENLLETTDLVPNFTKPFGGLWDILWWTS